MASWLFVSTIFALHQVARSSGSFYTGIGSDYYDGLTLKGTTAVQEYVVSYEEKSRDLAVAGHYYENNVKNVAVGFLLYIRSR